MSNQIKESPKVLKLKDYLTDSTGQMAINIIGIMTGQITYFYTNKVGVSAAMAGTILLLARIVDAISDIIMGKLVDRGNSSKGKARPWFLRMLIPLPLSIILMFTIPHGSMLFMTGYGVLSNVFASAVCYTAVCVPYYTLIRYTTRNSEERGNIGVARQVASYVIGYSITITILPVTNALGGNQKAWILYSCIYALIAFFCLLICYKGTKERYPDDQESCERERKISVVKSLGYLVRNPYWVKLALAGLLLQIIYVMITTAPMYYCRYVFGNENLYSVFSMVGLLASIAGFILTPIMIKKFGMVNSAKISLFIGLVGCIMRSLVPANLMMAYISNTLIMFGTVPTVSVLPILICNSIEYNKYKFDVTLTGMTTSANSFAAKIGMGLGSAVLGWVLAFGGFKEMETVQSASTIQSIYALNIWIPMILFIVIFVLLFKCDLDQKYAFYVEENTKNAK